MSYAKSILFAFVLVLQSLATNALAGPNASGGVPETAFEHDRSAVMTILRNEKLNELLQQGGALKSIKPAGDAFDVYVIETESCTAKARFERPCIIEPGQLPQCTYTSSVLEQACK